ncbi:MAG: peroxiredoxin [Planctomycetota bacterium]
MSGRWVRWAAMSLGLLAVAIAGCGEQEFSAEATEAAAAERSPAVGRTAPSFTLRNQRGEPVSLEDYRGEWVVLYFYPEDDTPGCTCQATEFSEIVFRFQDMGANVLGVSDNTPAEHRRFIDVYNLDLTLLSDSDHDVMTRYGAWVSGGPGGESHGRVVRQTYLIGPGGGIRYHWPEVIPRGHADRVADKLQEMQAGS